MSCYVRLSTWGRFKLDGSTNYVSLDTVAS